MRPTWIAACLFVVACSAARPSPAPVRGTPPRSAHDELREMCPMHVAGATVQVQDHELGAALAFTTTADVAEVRRRVRLMADIHDRRAAYVRERPRLPPATRLLEDVDGGARIVFRPADTSVDELKLQLVAEAERIARGHCPIAMPAEPSPGLATR